MTKNAITNVYTIWHCEGCEWMLPIDSNEFEKMIFDGRSHASSWNPVRMRRLKLTDDGQFLQPCDFPCGSGGTYLILSEAAKNKVGSFIEKYGEFLPLECDEGHFWAFHVTHFLDALNERASDVLRSPDEPNVVLMIHKHVFHPDRLTSSWMFKLPQSRGRDRIYVTEPFVNLIRTSGLTGLYFRKVWPRS